MSESGLCSGWSAGAWLNGLGSGCAASEAGLYRRAPASRRRVTEAIS